MKRIIIPVFVACFTWACEMEVEIEGLDYSKKLVVQGAISATDTFILVNVSRDYYIGDPIINHRQLNSNYTPYYWSGFNNEVKGAIVEIFENGSSLGFMQELVLETKEYPDGQIKEFLGFYYLPYQPLANSKYQIVVDHPQYQRSQASDTIPEIRGKVSIIEWDSVPNMIGGHEIRIRFDLVDLPGKDFYELVFLSEEPGWSDSSDEVVFSPRLSVSTVVEINNDIPGYFNPDNTQSILLSDETFDGEAFEIHLTFYSITISRMQIQRKSFDIEETLATMIELRQVSASYFRFWQSVNIQQQTKGDLTSQPVNIHSNVDGGLGVFGGYSAVRDTIFTY